MPGDDARRGVSLSTSLLSSWSDSDDAAGVDRSRIGTNALPPALVPVLGRGVVVMTSLGDATVDFPAFAGSGAGIWSATLVEGGDAAALDLNKANRPPNPKPFASTVEVVLVVVVEVEVVLVNVAGFGGERGAALVPSDVGAFVEAAVGGATTLEAVVRAAAFVPVVGAGAGPDGTTTFLGAFVAAADAPVAVGIFSPPALSANSKETAFKVGSCTSDKPRS